MTRRDALRDVDARQLAKVRELRRWTPRHVWTLHAVPGERPIAERVLAVRRRSLEMNYDSLAFEVGGMDTNSVDAEALERDGRARSYGSSLWDDKTGVEYGFGLSVWVYDHRPSLRERGAWLEEHVLEQAVLANPPTHVFVLLPGAVTLVRRKARRAMGHVVGSVSREDLHVALDERLPIERTHQTVDLHKLAVAGRDEIRFDDTGPAIVFLEWPSPEVLKAVVRERDKKRLADMTGRARARRDVEAMFAGAVLMPAAPLPPSA